MDFSKTVLPSMHRLSSSLRTQSPEESLKHAREIAATLGITRVTDTTWLDRLGIPVYASIRPNAATGSLCVNAGKGLHPVEAKIGAYMEAIELAYAEYGLSDLPVLKSSPIEIEESYKGRIRFVDFCPLLGSVVSPDEPMMAVHAHDLIGDHPVLLPAELTFIPFDTRTNKSVFGQSSNGLCSGNTVDEAIVHGLCELIERDVQAFNFISDQSTFINLDDCTPEVSSLINKINNAGLTLSVRYTESEFGFSYFQAFIMEAIPESPISIACGSGLHAIKAVALVRAICEAAQSRLSHIHGGRDDIMARVNYFEKSGRAIEMESIHKMRSQVLSKSKSVDYSALPNHGKHIRSISDALALVIDKLQVGGVSSIVSVPLTAKNMPIQVVRVVAPSLESFDPSLKRMGPRLLRYVSQKK